MTSIPCSIAAPGCVRVKSQMGLECRQAENLRFDASRGQPSLGLFQMFADTGTEPVEQQEHDGALWSQRNDRLSTLKVTKITARTTTIVPRYGFSVFIGE